MVKQNIIFSIDFSVISQIKKKKSLKIEQQLKLCMVYDAASSGYFYHKVKNRIRSNLPVIKIRAVQRQSSKSSNCQMNSKMCKMNIQIKIIWQ